MSQDTIDRVARIRTLIKKWNALEHEKQAVAQELASMGWFYHKKFGWFSVPEDEPECEKE